MPRAKFAKENHRGHKKPRRKRWGKRGKWNVGDVRGEEKPQTDADGAALTLAQRGNREKRKMMGDE